MIAQHKSTLLKKVHNEEKFYKSVVRKYGKNILHFDSDGIHEQYELHDKYHLLKTYSNGKKAIGVNRYSKANKLQETLQPSGTISTLNNYWQNKFEKFLGIGLPKIRIHHTHDSIEKAEQYNARSYAQGNNIYLGKDVKPIDTIEGKSLLAHEITHILQQKYLDMSSSDEMIDPSVKLERKAQIVEDRVKVNRGLNEASGDFFKKWDILPSRSYQSQTAINRHYIQRDGKSRREWVEKKLTGVSDFLGLGEGFNDFVDFTQGIAREAQERGVPLKNSTSLNNNTLLGAIDDIRDVSLVKAGIGAVEGIVNESTDYKYRDTVKKYGDKVSDGWDFLTAADSLKKMPDIKDGKLLYDLGDNLYKQNQLINPKELEYDLDKELDRHYEPSIDAKTLAEMEQNNRTILKMIQKGKFSSKKEAFSHNNFETIRRLTRDGKFNKKGGLYDWNHNKSYQQVRESVKPRYINNRTFDIQNSITKKYEPPIQRWSLKGAWESTKNMGSALAHSAGSVVEGISSVAKLSASGYTGMVAVGADSLGYDSIANKYSKVTKNLQSSASDDLNDATKHLFKVGKHSVNAVSQLVADKDIDELKKIHYNRNQYNYEPTDINVVKDKTKWKKLDDKKAIFHKMGKGNKNNSKYVSLDGHYEAVYHEDDSVVKNDVNKATYNFASPDNALSHTVKDVLPYFLWGNSKKDPTTMWERITASYSGDPEEKQSPIQRKILQKYQHPIQRWSLKGAWNSVTETASNIGNSVVDGVTSASKSVGKFATNTGTKIANKWNNSAIGKDINKHGKDYLNIGLNTLSATGKIMAGVATAAGTGLFTGGAGFVAGGAMIAGGLTDINKVVKGVHKSYLKHNGQSDEKAEKNRHGVLGLVGLNSAEKFAENNKYMKLGGTALDYTSGILTAGTALHQAGGLFSSAKSGMHYGQKTLATVNSKLAMGAYKNPNMVKGVMQVAKNSIKGAKWAYGKGALKTVSGFAGFITKPMKLSQDINEQFGSEDSIQRKKITPITNTIDKNLLESKSLTQPKTVEPEDSIKYAKTDRIEPLNNSIPKNTKPINQNIDELSMKIFRQLKLDISLEYVRSGR